MIQFLLAECLLGVRPHARSGGSGKDAPDHCGDVGVTQCSGGLEGAEWDEDR